MGVVVAALEYRKDKWYEVTGIILEGKLYRLRIRRLTPRECFRLQGFPDWFCFHRTKWHSFRMIGNSVSPLVSEKILQIIKNKINEYKTYKSS